MSVRIKICGIKTTDALDALIAANVDYFGLVFYSRSPRHVSIETAQALVAHAAGRCQAVALLVDPDLDDALEIAQTVKPDMIQLHGNESPDEVAAIAAATGLPIIKAVSIATEDDIDRARTYTSVAEIVLFDAASGSDAADSLPGGNGAAFDWRLLTGVKEQRQFMLSGGLNPDNVAGAIELTKAPIVDVSSGVERNRGEKDPELIRRFVSAARSAPQLG